MYLFMISCYLLMIFNLINLFICGSMGYTSFSVFGANHAQFSLFAILIFVFTETLIMYFFIATGKSIKTILGEQNPANAKELWEEVKQIKKIIFPQIMLTILLIGGLYIFYFGYIISNSINESLPYSWLQGPLYVLGITQHIWSLKIKNNSFKLQINIISKIAVSTK